MRDGGAICASAPTTSCWNRHGREAARAVHLGLTWGCFWGTDVLAALGCSKWTTPFVLMTAFGVQELHAQARELGATAVLDKPVDLDALRSVVWWAMDPR